MSYVLAAPDNSVQKYPYTISQLRADNPGTSFPAEPPPELLADWRMFEVVRTDPPTPAWNQNLKELPPQRVNGIWTQQWAIEAVVGEELARRTEERAQGLELDNAKLDAWIVAFLEMTPAGAQAYVNSNSPDLATLRTNVARLAYAVRVLVRREFNA